MNSENPGRKIAGHDDEMYKQVDGINIRVSGLQEEDVFTRDGVYKEMVKTIGKLSKMIKILDFTLNVKKYHEEGDEGKRKKYSINARIMSNEGMFHADDHEWSIFKAVEKTMQKLENEVFRKEDRSKVHKKAH